MYAAALIDHHPLLRLGLARILSRIPSIHEVRSYEPTQIDAERVRSTSGMRVEILLFGQSDDAEFDQALLQHLVELLDPRQILVLSEDIPGGGLVHERIAGRVRKSASAEVIEAAVRLIIAGGSCFPVEMDLQSTREGAMPASADEPGGLAVWEIVNSEGGSAIMSVSARDLRITPRQFEILVLRAQGLSLKETARMLGISEATVKAHASAMFRRLNVSNQMEAVKLVQDQGIRLTDAIVYSPR